MEKPTQSEQELKALQEKVKDPEVKKAIEDKLKTIKEPITK